MPARTTTMLASHCNQPRSQSRCRRKRVPNGGWAGNEHTKGSVSVIAARNWATGTGTGIGTSKTANRTSKTNTKSKAKTTRKTLTMVTTAKMTAPAAEAEAARGERATHALGQQSRQFLRTSRKTSWLLPFVCLRLRQHLVSICCIILLASVGFGTRLVTCSSISSTATYGTGSYHSEFTTASRSTLPDRPMTTQNDLITTASNLAAATTETVTRAGAGSGLGLGPQSMALAQGMSSGTETAATSTTTAATRILTTMMRRTRTKSAQIGLTTETTEKQTNDEAGEGEAGVVAMLISTIYPTETDTHNSIEMATTATTATTHQATHDETTAVLATQEVKEVAAEAEAEEEEESQVEPKGKEEEEEAAVLPHSVDGADSLTKGFSIPTFLPPFPVFAAADLPAYRARAAAEAEAAAAAAAAAETSSIIAFTSTMSPAEQRRKMFNEQHSYLVSRNGQRRNLTIPVLNLTAQMGNHAYMPCQIHRLSDKPVSWVRMRDNHIISVDESTFIADERFQSIFQEDHDYTWSLQIKYVQPQDEGFYECQMATEPKLSAKVHLEVVTPKTELIGDQSRFVKAGSKVALHCIVRGTLDPPKYIIWFRGQKKISETDERTGWYTQIDRNIFGTIGDNQNTIGSLIIPLVRKEDSGNYTCQPSNSISVSVDLHVLSGEYSASAIMSKASLSWNLRSTSQLLLVLLLTLRLMAGLLGRGMEMETGLGLGLGQEGLALAKT